MPNAIPACEPPWFRCAKCDYSLTGLTTNICPECGTPFDPEFLRLDPELRRRGLPIHGKQGIGLILPTIVTVLLLLFRPITFAKRMRVDEPVRPSVTVFLPATVLYPPIVFVLLFSYAHPTRLFNFVATSSTMVAWVGLMALILAVLLSLLGNQERSNMWTFRTRFRFWCMVLMYSTPFLFMWWFIGADTRELSWGDYITDWPYVRMYVRNQAYYTGFFLFWWTLVVCVVVWRRHRPRWAAIPLFVFVYVFVRYSVQAADICIPRLAR